jgi:hypothetical protein
MYLTPALIALIHRTVSRTSEVTVRVTSGAGSSTDRGVRGAQGLAQSHGLMRLGESVSEAELNYFEEAVLRLALITAPGGKLQRVS